MKYLSVSEVRNYLNGKRVFVGDKSADIQRVAIAAGYLWGKDPMDVIKHLDKPFLFFTIKENGAWIKSTNDLDKFNKSSKTLISVDDILSIRFKDVEVVKKSVYNTADQYIANHKAEIDEAARERSLSEAIREGRVTPPCCADPVAVGVDASDVRRAYANGYENGWSDHEEGLEYNPSID